MRYIYIYTGACPGGAKGAAAPPPAPKYLRFSDRELRFEKNLNVLAPILTEIGIFKNITPLLKIMQ